MINAMCRTSSRYRYGGSTCKRYRSAVPTPHSHLSADYGHHLHRAHDDHAPRSSQDHLHIYLDDVYTHLEPLQADSQQYHRACTAHTHPPHERCPTQITTHFQHTNFHPITCPKYIELPEADILLACLQQGSRIPRPRVSPR
jgi:hypothetical protein